ncbi:MAG: GNAT family N-acetyltransferase [Alphaproteobacteria bacterium]|nr:GNAT family N-acetyltransferase [Alphaproteobacteria bacterium]
MQPFNSERLYYRPYRRSDAEAAFVFFGDPEVMKYSAFGVHPTIERTVEMLADLIADNRRHGFGFWAVVERETDVLIGMAGLTEFDEEESDFELAYRLRRDRWGRGYGTEAAAAWVAQGFSVLDLPHIVAVVEPDHAVSKIILERVGMRFVEQRTLHGKLVDYMVVERPEASWTINK